MVALFDNLAVRHNDYIVRVLYGGKSVRDYQHRADVHHFFKRVLNQKFGFGVDIGGRFVQNHYFRLMNYRSGKGEQLSLPGGQVVAAFADFFVKPLGQFVYKTVRIDVWNGIIKIQ